MRTTTKSPGHWLRSAVSLFITAAMVLGIVLTIPFSGLTAFAQLHDLTAPDFRENLWIDYDFTENMDDTANEIVTNKADDIGDGLTAERFNASFSATQNGMVNPRNVAFQPNYESGSVHFDDGTMEDKDSIRFRNDDTDRGNYWDGSRPHLYMRGQTAGEMWGIFERLADAYTISMWVKMDDANVHKYSTLFTAGNFNGNNEAALNVHLWAGRIRVRYKEQGGSTTMVDTDARLTGGYWQLITVAQQENNVKIYMDGTLLRSINDASLVGDGFGFGYDPNTSVSSRALWMDIGGNSADLDGSRYESSMVGNMGSFRIYKGQLTDEDVQALYKYHADNAKDGVPLARRSANAIDWAESVLPNGEDVVASWRVIDYKGEKAFSANYDEGWVATASDAEVRRKNYQGDQTDGRITTAMHLTAEHRSKVAEVIADTGANTPLYIKYMFKTEGRLRRSDITMDNGEFGAGFMHNYGGVAGATGSPNDFRFGPKMMQRALIPDYGTNEGAGNLSDPNVSRQADILTNPRLHRGTTSGIGSTPRKEGRRINSAWDWALYDGKWISSTSTGNWGNPAASAGLTAGGLNLDLNRNYEINSFFGAPGGETASYLGGWVVISTDPTPLPVPDELPAANFSHIDGKVENGRTLDGYKNDWPTESTDNISWDTVFDVFRATANVNMRGDLTDPLNIQRGTIPHLPDAVWHETGIAAGAWPSYDGTINVRPTAAAHANRNVLNGYRWTGAQRANLNTNRANLFLKLTFKVNNFEVRHKAGQMAFTDTVGNRGQFINLNLPATGTTGVQDVRIGFHETDGTALTDGGERPTTADYWYDRDGIWTQIAVPFRPTTFATANASNTALYGNFQILNLARNAIPTNVNVPNSALYSWDLGGTIGWGTSTTPLEIPSNILDLGYAKYGTQKAVFDEDMNAWVVLMEEPDYVEGTPRENITEDLEIKSANPTATLELLDESGDVIATGASDAGVVVENDITIGIETLKYKVRVSYQGESGVKVEDLYVIRRYSNDASIKTIAFEEPQYVQATDPNTGEPLYELDSNGDPIPLLDDQGNEQIKLDADGNPVQAKDPFTGELVWEVEPDPDQEIDGIPKWEILYQPLMLYHYDSPVQPNPRVENQYSSRIEFPELPLMMEANHNMARFKVFRILSDGTRAEIADESDDAMYHDFFAMVGFDMGVNNFEIEVVAMDGTEVVYTLVVTRYPSSDSRFKRILVNGDEAEEHPTWRPDESTAAVAKYIYNSDDSDINIVVEMEHPEGRYNVFDELLNPISFPDRLTMNQTKTYDLRFLAENDGNPFSVLLDVTRLPSEDATIGLLKVNGDDAVYDDQAEEYSAVVDRDTAVIEIKPNNENAEILEVMVDGDEIWEELDGTFRVDFGSNIGTTKIVTFEIRPERAGISPTVHTLVLTRELSTDVRMDVTVGGRPAVLQTSGTYNGKYYIALPNNFEEVEIAAIPNHPDAVVVVKDSSGVEVDAPVTLVADDPPSSPPTLNEFTITITPVDVTAEQTFDLVVWRRDPSIIEDATLQELKIDDINIALQNNQYEYNIELPYGASTVNITAVPNHNEASIQSGDGERAISFQGGRLVVVVESNAGTTQEYAINVTFKSVDLTINYGYNLAGQTTSRSETRTINVATPLAEAIWFYSDTTVIPVGSSIVGYFERAGFSTKSDADPNVPGDIDVPSTRTFNENSTIYIVWRELIATASISNVSINGEIYKHLAAQDVTVTLQNADFAKMNAMVKVNEDGEDGEDGEEDEFVENDLSSWFRALPNGLVAVLKNDIPEFDPNNPAATKTAVFTLKGIPTVGSAGNISIVIPGTALVDRQEAIDTQQNGQATYNIPDRNMLEDKFATTGPVTIVGSTGNPIEDTVTFANYIEMAIYLNNDEFVEELEIDEDVTDWFTNIPPGINVRVLRFAEEENEDGDGEEYRGTVYLAVYGIPSTEIDEEISERINIVVPGSMLVNTTDYIIVDYNEEARYFIEVDDSSENANLASLTVTPGTLEPEFDPDETEYVVNVAGTVGSVVIAAKAEAEYYEKIDGIGSKTVNPGTNVFEVVVVAERTSVTKTYTITVNRPAATVTFNGNGAPNPPSRTVGVGATIGTLPTVSIAGQIFAGWFTANTGGTQVTAETAVNANMTVFARWTPATVTTWTVTFMDGSRNLTNLRKTVNNNTRVTNPKPPAKKNQTFVGWFTSNTGGSQFNFGRNITANVTLYARYERNPAKPTKMKAKRSKRKARVSWKKQNGVTVEIQQRIGAKGKWTRTGTTKKAGANSFTTKNLRKGRRYQFRARAIKRIAGRVVRSAWSGASKALLIR